MNFLRRRLYEDPSNIELRHYCLIELILNEQWNEILDILEETPHFHFNRIQFALKYFPLTMMNNQRIEKLKQWFKSFEIFDKRTSVEIYRNEKMCSSSSSSSSTSIESLDQSILFLSQAKFYKNRTKIGKGECEIIENNQSGYISTYRFVLFPIRINLGEIFLRFWILKNRSIHLILLVNLNQLDHFYLYSNIYSSFIIKFKAKNQCNYPISNYRFSYQIQFYSMMDLIQFKETLSLRKMDILSHP